MPKTPLQRTSLILLGGAMIAFVLWLALSGFIGIDIHAPRTIHGDFMASAPLAILAGGALLIFLGVSE